MNPIRYVVSTFLLAAALASTAASAAVEKSESFDRDPKWEGINNRATAYAPRTIRQDFGHSPGTRRAGGKGEGEVGGGVTPAAEPAFYAKRISARNLNDRLSASGSFSCSGAVHVLVGFFNAGTVNEWRTPNSLGLRIQGRGDVLYAYVEYATARWRAGGDHPRPFPAVVDARTGRSEPKGFAARSVPHSWSLEYDPEAAGGRGAVTATIDGVAAVCELTEGHRADGATFDRFGILNVVKSADSPGEIHLDDLTLDGVRDDFSADPDWDGRNNRRTYVTTNIRPRFDFGWAESNLAGGSARGEIGGLIFRGDIREAARIAAYGDRVGPLRLDRPLRASGTIAMHRGVSDSTTLLGFYHSKKSVSARDSQASGWPEPFLGLAVEGPSRDGFFVYPAYRTAFGVQGSADGPDRPPILPDGKPHRWTLVYVPSAPGRKGRLALTLDGKSSSVEVDPGDAPDFDRFGIVTTWIDGNAQVVHHDDLTYTVSQDR